MSKKSPITPLPHTHTPTQATPGAKCLVPPEHWGICLVDEGNKGAPGSVWGRVGEGSGAFVVPLRISAVCPAAWGLGSV